MRTVYQAGRLFLEDTGFTLPRSSKCFVRVTSVAQTLDLQIVDYDEKACMQTSPPAFNM